jgi:hypothetical protein
MLSLQLYCGFTRALEEHGTCCILPMYRCSLSVYLRHLEDFGAEVKPSLQMLRRACPQVFVRQLAKRNIRGIRSCNMKKFKLPLALATGTGILP